MTLDTFLEQALRDKLLNAEEAERFAIAMRHLALVAPDLVWPDDAPAWGAALAAWKARQSR
jgi:hypothetical protein